MDWLKKHYDRVILAVLGVIVLICAGVIILQVSAFNETFTTRNSAKRQNNDVPVPGTELVRIALKGLEKPKDWGVYKASLFVSEPYILREGNDEPVPISGDNDLFPPIKNEWIRKYSLNFADGNLPNADPDSDKFSNSEEFAGGTDPTDPKSMPPFYTKLRLLEFIQKAFRLKFSGSPDTDIYSINTMDLRGPTQFLKIGEMVAGTQYKVVKYDKKVVDKDGLEVDVSELTVENQETGQKIVLVNDEPVNDPTVFAKLKYLWDGSEFTVKKLDSFAIKPEETIKYKLIDISEDKAVIQSPEGKEITVPKGT